MAKTMKPPSDVRDYVLAELKSKERNLAWLSKKTDIPYGTLYAAVRQRTCQISAENLTKINNVLETDFSL